MCSFTPPPPTLLAGFVVVLVGYASPAATIWQAAASAGTTPGQIADRMTALGLAVGISTLALSGWRKVPVLTTWSTPGVVLLVSGLQGVILAEVAGMFISANALTVLYGATGLFARLMKITSHSLAAVMLAGVLLRSGLQAFAGLQEHLLPYGGTLVAWLLRRALWPRFAVVAALVVGALIVAASGDISRTAVPLAFATPEWIVPQFTLALLPSVGLPFFPVTMALQNAPGFATLQVSGYTVPASAPLVVYGSLVLLLAPFGVYSIYIAAIVAAVCQSPETHPNPQQCWLAVMVAGSFYLLAGLFGGPIIALIPVLPAAWIQILAGLALLGTTDGSLFQAVCQASERDTAVLTFLVTANGVMLARVGSVFWDVVFGGVSYGALSTLRRPQLERCQAGGRFHPMAEMAGGAEAAGQRNLR